MEVGAAASVLRVAFPARARRLPGLSHLSAGRRQGTKKLLFEISGLFYRCALAAVGQGGGEQNKATPNVPGVGFWWDF